MYGALIINSVFTLALVCGVTVGELTHDTATGRLGFEQMGAVGCEATRLGVMLWRPA